MSTRKPSSKTSNTSVLATLARHKEESVFPLELKYARIVKVPSAKKIPGAKLVRVWGNFDDVPGDRDWNRVPRMPNPVPDNIISLLKLAGEATWLTIPLAPYIYLLIKSWLEGRNSRKLKLRNGDFEIELQGTWSERKLRKEFDRFRKMTKDLNENDIQVIENGKVIQRQSNSSYKVKESDIKRVTERETKKRQTTSSSRTKAVNKGRVMNDDFTAIACRPADLSRSERDNCIRIVQQGSAVNPESAAYELPRALMIAVLRAGTEIIGTGAVKRKRSKYALDIARQSRFTFDPERHELGYIAIDKRHRGKHLSHKILAALVSNYDRPLFATTDNKNMKSSLRKAGFKREGKGWQGNRGRLSLWLKD
jgi:hypothetical protein